MHYDTSPAVYATRKSDMSKWRAAFPDAEVVMYRLDVPRECRDQVTQVLDGYGPWGWDDEEGVDRDDDGEDGEGGRNDSGRGEKGTTRRKKKFVETGRPLRIEEWDEEVKSSVLDRGEVPPDDRDAAEDDDDDSPYSPRAIREREGGYRLLAAYTPGHTFGSVSYIFPRRGICCSGYALPVETSRQVAATGGYDDDDDSGVDSGGTYRDAPSIPPGGPRLDYRGYLAASASRPRQMSSALMLVNDYVDRFRVVLPARGDAVYLDSAEETRRRELMESVGLYGKIGDIYGRLGIVE